MYLVVVSQQLVEEVDGFIRDKTLVLRCDEAVPRLLLEPTEDIVVLSVEFDLVLVEVIKQLVRAKDLSNLDELIRVAVAVKERLFAEDHGGKHGAQAPHVEAVIVLLEVDEQLGTLEVSRSDPNVVLRLRVVELGQTPVNEPQLLHTC